MYKNEKLGYRYIASGVKISNDTRKTHCNNNDLVIGSAGSGKSGGYVFPNLLHPCGSIVVSDTKRTLHSMFKERLEKQGYQVQVLDFVDPSKSVGYNPLRYIRRYRDGSPYEVDIKTLATTLAPSLDSRDPFWDRAAVRYISALIGYVIEALPVEEQNMPMVCEVHRQFMENPVVKNEWIEESPHSFSARKFMEMASTKGADKMWSSILEFVNEALDLFEYREIKPMFEKKKTVDLHKIGKQKTVLFLNSSDNDPTFDKLVNIFHTQLLQTLITDADKSGGTLDVPTRIILDDFAASAKLPDFERTISIIRSRDISVSIILQSMTQLESMYDVAASATIINNCDHILFLGSNDLRTAEFVGTHLDKTSTTALRLEVTKAILISHGQKAVYVDKIAPYSMPIDEMDPPTEVEEKGVIR